MITHRPTEYVCPFCCIANGTNHHSVETKESDVVFQNSEVAIFIGSFQWPNNPGHVIIIPNKHYENIFDFPAEEAGHIQKATKLIALAMKRAYSCEGVSTSQHNEPFGGQDVWHYHVHVFPRYENDKLYESHDSLMSPIKRANYCERLRTAIEGINEFIT